MVVDFGLALGAWVDDEAGRSRSESGRSPWTNWSTAVARAGNGKRWRNGCDCWAAPLRWLGWRFGTKSSGWSEVEREFMSRTRQRVIGQGIAAVVCARPVSR